MIFSSRIAWVSCSCFSSVAGCSPISFKNPFFSFLSCQFSGSESFSAVIGTSSCAHDIPSQESIPVLPCRNLERYPACDRHAAAPKRQQHLLNVLFVFRCLLRHGYLRNSPWKSIWIAFPVVEQSLKILAYISTDLSSDLRICSRISASCFWQ